jgi:hypothetical protein
VLRHVVLFRWKDGTTAEQVDAVVAGLRGLPARIPELRRYHVGPDAGLVAGNHDFAVVADVDDVEAWTAYREHPEHQRALAELITPIVESRIAVQYELPDA